MVFFSLAWPPPLTPSLLTSNVLPPLLLFSSQRKKALPSIRPSSLITPINQPIYVPLPPPHLPPSLPLSLFNYLLFFFPSLSPSPPLLFTLTRLACRSPSAARSRIHPAFWCCAPFPLHLPSGTKAPQSAPLTPPHPASRKPPHFRHTKAEITSRSLLQPFNTTNLLSLSRCGPPAEHGILVSFGWFFGARLDSRAVVLASTLPSNLRMRVAVATVHVLLLQTKTLLPRWLFGRTTPCFLSIAQEPLS